jgi:glyceraldehyde 3-phosphate dehydrogenase
VDGNLHVDGREYRYTSEKDPVDLPWGELGVDLVFECTGVFLTRDDLTKHLEAGARYVILSAPSKSTDIGN